MSRARSERSIGSKRVPESEFSRPPLKSISRALILKNLEFNPGCQDGERADSLPNLKFCSDPFHRLGAYANNAARGRAGPENARWRTIAPDALRGRSVLCGEISK